jgi:D-alanine-D-alanine ligase
VLTNLKIGVLMGGTSAEREVSLRSGEAVYLALQERGYSCVRMDADADICTRLRTEGVKIAFLALHGGWGEDGSIQGMLEILRIPYTGSGVLASSLAMDKAASKKLFLFHRIPVPPFTLVRKGDVISLPDFGPPWVVKPSNEGSSVGVQIVRENNLLVSAVEQTFTYGEKVIVEEFIAGKEIQIGIVNNRVLGGVEVRPSLEFYSYEAKYTPGLTDYILPPQIEESAYEKSKNVSLAAHNALGCRGATRVDLRLHESGEPYVLEVNTIPGMTETSLLPKIAGLSGLDFGGLIEEILKDALDESK